MKKLVIISLIVIIGIIVASSYFRIPTIDGHWASNCQETFGAKDLGSFNNSMIITGNKATILGHTYTDQKCSQVFKTIASTADISIPDRITNNVWALNIRIRESLTAFNDANWIPKGYTKDVFAPLDKVPEDLKTKLVVNNKREIYLGQILYIKGDN